MRRRRDRRERGGAARGRLLAMTVLSCDSENRDAISGEAVRPTGIHHLASRTSMRSQFDLRLMGNFAVRGGLIALSMLIDWKSVV